MDYDKSIKREEEKIRKLRRRMDLTMVLIAQGSFSQEEALRLIEAAKQYALSLFADKEETFELIYRPRFQRLLAEKYRTN